MDELKGNAVLIDFWQTVCRACLQIVPYLGKEIDKMQVETNITFK